MLISILTLLLSSSSFAKADGAPAAQSSQTKTEVTKSEAESKPARWRFSAGYAQTETFESGIMKNQNAYPVSGYYNSARAAGAGEMVSLGYMLTPRTQVKALGILYKRNAVSMPSFIDIERKTHFQIGSELSWTPIGIGGGSKRPVLLLGGMFGVMTMKGIANASDEKQNILQDYANRIVPSIGAVADFRIYGELSMLLEFRRSIIEQDLTRFRVAAASLSYGI